MEDAMTTGAPDLEPIPVFNWENALLNQKRQNMNQANNMQSSFNYVPLSPEIYGETKELDPQEDMFAPMLEPRSINSMVTPIWLGNQNPCTSSRLEAIGDNVKSIAAVHQEPVVAALDSFDLKV